MTANTYIALIVGYLLGSVPFAFLAGRVRGIDLRTVGSGNLGAANVFRNLGSPARRRPSKRAGPPASKITTHPS